MHTITTDLTLQSAIIGIIIAGVIIYLGIYIKYLIIKKAVRDGILEAEQIKKKNQN